MSEAKKPSRRQFLAGRAAADAVADRLAREADEAAGNADPAGSDATYLLHVARRAMACDFAVFLNAGQHDQAAERAVEALDLVEQLESQLTVYRGDSEVSLINQRAAKQAIVVEARLFGLLQMAVELHDATGGAFDITSGALSKVWGFYRREGRIPAEEALRAALDRVGGKWLCLDAERQSIQFLKQGVDINLGGIGKGYALDRSAQLLSLSGVEDFLMHGGQSSILARGHRARGSSRAGWPVGIRHPLRPERRLAEVWLRDRAIGTSGSGTQSFHHQGRRYGHILDPRSGQPAEGVFSSTVIAPSAAVADALATAFYVLGVEKSHEYCAAHPELAAIIVTPGARTGAVEVHSCGLTDEDWRLGDDV